VNHTRVGCPGSLKGPGLVLHDDSAEPSTSAHRCTLADVKPAALFASLLVGLSVLCVQAQPACDSGAPARDAAQVAALRTSLRATPQRDSPDTDVTPGVQALISQLKSALAQAVRDTLVCSATSESPAALQARFAALLKANPPQPVENSVSNGDPRYQEYLSFEWSSNLLVKVRTFSPTLLGVQLSFRIPYSQDTMLLLYARDGDHWHEALRWQAQPYSDVGDAFGDAFFAALLTPSPGEWRIVAIHGHAQAASRFSVFYFDILAPTSNPERPRVVWHSERSYSIGDYSERLKVLGPDTFEFRNNADAMEFDPDTAFERTVVYRFRLSGDKVMRLEPTNGRGFVEEWLTMPWDEAAAQSAPEALASLRPLHLLHDQNKDGNLKSYIGWTAGPVRACSAAGRFQVAFDSQHENLESTKPGGDKGSLLHAYFFIQQVADGYRMESVSSAPDGGCKGPDLMRTKSQ
jgi:hypothetical protein